MNRRADHIHARSSTIGGIDALASLLDGTRDAENSLLRAVMSPPWSILVADEAPLAVVVVSRGHAWFLCDDHEPRRLGSGDIALVRGPNHYVIADAPTTPHQVVVHPGQRCQTVGGADVAASMTRGVRTWGTAHDPDDPTATATEMLIGVYESIGAVGRRVLDSLPTTMVTTADALDAPLVELVRAEIVKVHPGQQIVLARVMDLLAVAALRSWIVRSGDGGTAWFRAYADDVVGPALQRLHDQPAQPWTVASLAREVGVSRAALARRFTDLVGEPPMTHLTSWRLALAADLIEQPGATLGGVADQVGYSSAFALSTAFKRVRGLSPADHRRRAAARSASTPSPLSHHG